MRIICVMSCAPRSASGVPPSLAVRPRRRLQDPGSATSPPSANSNNVVGLRPPLKEVNARPAASVCAGSCPAKRSGSLLAVTASFRYPPRFVVVMQKHCLLRLWCSGGQAGSRPATTRSCKASHPSTISATERRSAACGPRQPAPGRRRAGPQTSCVPTLRRE